MSDLLSASGQQKVASSTARLLEEAAFVFAAPVDEPAPFLSDPIEASLYFDGPSSGLFRLTAAPEFGEELATALLGLGPGDSQAATLSEEALRETLNMLAGVLLETWFGSQARCELGTPRSEVISAEVHEARRNNARFAMSLLTDEDHRIDLTVEVPA